MTVRKVDVENTFDDPEEGWFGAAEPAEVASGAEHHDETGFVAESAEDTDRWFVQDMDLAGPYQPAEPFQPAAPEGPSVVESVATTRNVVPTRRNGFVRAAAPASWESRISNSGAWDFKTRSDTSRPGIRVVLVAAAIIAGVVAVVGAVLFFRSSAPAVEDATTAPPSQSAPLPEPTKSAPAPSAELPPPLPPPPPAPPLPSAEQIVPPVTRQYNPSYQTPDEPRKPQTNVTRTPMSATPPAPPRQTDQGRATPGESGHHGFFG